MDVVPVAVQVPVAGSYSSARSGKPASTRPSGSNVAGAYPTSSRSGLPVADQVPVTGSYSSAVCPPAPSLDSPPMARTRPSRSRTSLPSPELIIDPVRIHVPPGPSTGTGLAEGRARSLGLGDVASRDETASCLNEGEGGSIVRCRHTPAPAASAPPTSNTAAAAASRVMPRPRPRPNRRWIGTGAAIIRRLWISSRRLDGAAGRVARPSRSRSSWPSSSVIGASRRARTPELPTHCLQASVKARFDRTHRAVKASADRLQREVCPEVKDQDHSLVVTERSQRAEQLIAGIDIAERVVDDYGACRAVEGHEADLAPAPQPIAADVDQDPVEPGVEPGGIAKRRSGAPGPDERILRCVLGLGPIAENQAGEPE